MKRTPAMDWYNHRQCDRRQAFGIFHNNIFETIVPKILFLFITMEFGGRTFHPVQFQPMQFQPLPLQPLTISTYCIFNRPPFRPKLILANGSYLFNNYFGGFNFHTFLNSKCANYYASFDTIWLLHE